MQIVPMHFGTRAHRTQIRGNELQPIALFTRSSPTSRKTVGPRARLAAPRHRHFVTDLGAPPPR